MDILNTQILNEITNTIRVCVNDAAIIELSDQSEFGNGYFVEWTDKIVKITKLAYDEIIFALVDKREFNTSPFDYKKDYFLTNLGFQEEIKLSQQLS